MPSDFFISVVGLCLVITGCLTWLLFIINYILEKHSTPGNRRKQQRRKKQKMQNSRDDVPIKGTNLNPFSTPKIETSFGDKRIGKVHKDEKAK